MAREFYGLLFFDTELTRVTDRDTKVLLSSLAISMWNVLEDKQFFAGSVSSDLTESLMKYLTFRQEALLKIQVRFVVCTVLCIITL